MKHLEPKLRKIETTVEVPVRTDYTLYARTEIHEWIAQFKEMAERAEWFEVKHDADLCRCVLEWAAECKAITERVFNDKDKNGHLIVFVLSFEDYDNSTKFVSELKQKVKAQCQ